MSATAMVEEKQDEWSLMIKRYGFLKPLAIGQQSIEPCGFKIDDNESNCPCFDRVKYVLTGYDKLSVKIFSNNNNNNLSICNYINNYLYCYNITALLNDFNHILKFHKDNDEQFEFMSSKLGKCNIAICDKIKRNEQKRRYQNVTNYCNNNLYFGISDELEISCIDTLDRIHCSLCHDYDLFRLTISQKKRLQRSDTSARSELSSSTMAILHEINSKSVDNLKMIRKRNYNKFTDFVGAKTHNMNNKEISVDPDITMDIEADMAMYDFGCEYNYNELRPMHHNLKQELTDNTIYKISLIEWNCTLEKAYILNKCQYARNMFHAKHLKDIDFICRHNYYHNYHPDYAGTLVSSRMKQKIKAAQIYDTSLYVQNILALLFYCNFDELQYHLSQTYRLCDGFDTKHKMSQRHRQFAHWAMLIHDMASLFGCSMTKSEETVYRGLGANMIVSKRNACFYAPTSTSTNILVAQHFAGNQGCILCLNDNTVQISSYNRNIPTYIDCSWISDYHYEAERLFVGKMIDKQVAGNMLTISSIINCSSGKTAEIMEIPIAASETFYKTVTRRHTNTSTLFGDNITGNEYVEIINKIFYDSTDDIQRKYILQRLNIMRICQSVNVIHLSDSIVGYYPKIFIKNNTFNLSVIAALFPNATDVWIYIGDIEHILYKSAFRTVKTKKNNKISRIHIGGNTRNYNYESWLNKFASLGWYLTKSDGIEITNIIDASINVEYVRQTSPQIYRINTSIDDKLLTVYRRYKQFRGFRKRLMNARIINNEMIFPDRGFCASDINKRKRAIGLNTFISNVVNKCKDKNRFDLIIAFLFEYSNYYSYY